jgi:hypothetical protein
MPITPPPNPEDIIVLLNALSALKNLNVGPGLVMNKTINSITIGLAPKREYKPEPFVSGGKPLYKITEASGTFPTFDYVGQRVTGYDSSLTGHARWTTDGVDVDLINRCEFAPAGGTYPYTYGTGNSIEDSDGTIEDSSCVIIPIGVGAVVEVDVHVDTVEDETIYSFFAANSSEAAS